MGNRTLCKFSIALPFTIAGFLGLTFNNSAFAQLTPDNTLGAENSIVTPQQLRDLIQGGAIRGNALFHSFDEFNVVSDRGVFFDLQNNANILNIFTRVTGSNSSQIFGTLGVLNDLGSANLFLLNPNGITFGANASLQLNGSFFATTADGFGFDNFTFSASGGEAPPPLLTVSIPPFLSFRDNPGDITVNQSNLTVNQEQSLSLVGGNVTVTGSRNGFNRPVNLSATDGRIEVGSVSSSGSVSFSQTNAGLVLDYEGIDTFQDINFNQLAFIDTTGEGGGSIQLQGRNIRLSGEARVYATNQGSQTGGGIIVNSEQLVVDDSSLIAEVFGSGQGGNLNINTSQLIIQNGGRVNTTTFGEGNGGNVTVNASDSVQVIGTEVDGVSIGSLLASRTSGIGKGNAGDVIINTSQLLIQNGGNVSGSAIGEGSGGNVIVNALDSVQVIGTEVGSSSLLQTNAISDTSNAGDLTVNTPRLLVQGDAVIRTDAFETGNGGNIKINVDETILIEGSGGILSTAQFDSTGSAGSISIDSQQLTVRDGGIISVQSFGTGTGGNLSITSDNLILDNGTISAETINSDSGNVVLNISDLLLLRNGNGNALISATAGGEGNGGNLTINTTFLVSFPNENSDITANADLGNAGLITITAEGLFGFNVLRNRLTDQSDITAFSQRDPVPSIQGDIPETFVNQAPIEKPEEVVDSSDITTQSACYDFGGDSQLANSGRGGIPQIPGLVVRNSVINVDLVDEVLLPPPPPEAIKPHHRTDVTFLDSEGEEIKPAMGAVLLPDGMVEFVDYNPAEVYRDMYAAAGCSANK